jgi:hypothetical protein
MYLGRGKDVVVKGKLVEEQQEHAKEHAEGVEEHIVWALCCMAVAAGRLDMAVQGDCTPQGCDRRLWKDPLDWWRICGSGQSTDNTRL